MMIYCHSILLKVGVILTNFVKPAIFTLQYYRRLMAAAGQWLSPLTISLEASTFLEYLFPNLGKLPPSRIPQTSGSSELLVALNMQFSSFCFLSPAVFIDG